MCFVVIQFFQTRRAGERAHHNGWLPVPVVAFFTALLLLAGGLQAATFDTPVTVSSLDFSAYAQWVDGAETTATNLSDPTRVLYTQTTVPNFNGYGFGESTNPGPRHLRIGFTAPMAVGSVLVRGSGKLSVLASNAPYPGNLTNESHWLPAQRLTTALGITANEVPDNGYAIWVLPPGTTTRALRFSHTSAVSDPAYVGRAAGAWLLTNRFANLAPQAPILTSTNQALAGRINNETDEMFNAWDNGFNGGTNVVSTTNFEWVILTWPTNISLNGLCALWAGFSEGTVQNYSGPANIHPRNADESMWTTLVASTNIQNQYPWFLPPNFLDFGSNVTTRALRLKITKAINEATSHAGLAGSSRAGKRVWLGDLLALAPLGTNDLASAVVPHVTLQPPIPVPFFLSQPGYVTLVIEDAAGKRVRNLVGETFFPAGTNLVYWDGLDESGKVDTGQHGEYAVQGALVPAGNYKVRGLQRDAIDLRYEFSVYHNGNPPWITANDTGGWLADHTPPSDVAFLPGATNEVLISSFIAEDGAGFVWVDLNGRRTHSRKWVGGTFTGATHLSRDRGAQRNTNHMVYSGSAWEGALRLYGLMTNGEEQVAQYNFAVYTNAAISGLAVHNGNLIASLPALNQLLFVSVGSHSVLGTVTVTDPRGLAFQTNGNLLVLSGNSLQRYFPSPGQAVLGPPTVLVTGLDNPQRVMVDDATGNIYVSVHGASHQVKVFSGNGAFIRDIGIPGAPATGPYDPAKMHRPMGMTISGDGTLWVAEEDYAPRRVSVWQTDGTFVRAFYGSTDYGGGGSLDPLDKSIFRYRDDHGAGAMEFQLDWATGSNTLVSLYHRPTTNDLPPPNNSPQAALVNVFNGETNVFLTDCYSDNPVGGRFTIGLWQMREGQAKFVAAFGMANTWAPLQTTQFNAMVPPPGNVFASVFDKPVLFVWSDLNDDGIIQTNEVQFRSEQGGYATVNQNLEFATVKAHVFSPVSFTSNGVPIYDLNAGQFAATNFYLDGFTTGSGEVMQTTNGWTVTTGGPLNGMTGGQLMWTYPNPWPSLLAAANAPIATNGGQLVGTTRLLGTTVRPRSGDAGDLFAVNGDYGQVYLFTTDGLFLSTLFKDSRTVPAWSMPVAQRNMSLTGVTLQQECFWDTINQTGDGEIYFVAGHNHASIVRVDGLTNVTRLATNDLVVTPELVIAAANYQTELEILRQSQVGYDTLTAQLVAAQLVMDGQSNDWSTASVVPIDAQASAAVMLTSNYLYAAYWTGDSNLLVNSGVSTELLFKTGGALDLMLATDPNADPTRTAPVAGDLRLLVTLANGAVKATLYRAVVPGTTNPVPFSSPYRTIYLDRVDDVSASVQLAIGPGGFYEFRVPLALLGFAPTNGEVTLGDVGLLRGAGGATVQRVYWHNKSTGLVSDVPSEAELTPELWGHLQIGAFVPPVAATPYEVWRNQKFAPWELGSASIVSPNADPNGDGVPNQLAYALNLEPKSQQPANLPGVASASNHLTVSYTRVKTATDINYSVLVSGDLATWSSGPAFTTVSGVTDFGLTEKITVSDLTAMSATNRRFMRLKVDGVTGSLAVTVTQPVTGNFFIAPANIAITAAPTSGNSFVNRVEFYNGATKIGERTNAPYSMVWSNISLGGYALSARALDSLGNNATSPVVSISVFSALPFISAVANQVINEDTIAGPIAFTLGDADTPISNLVLSASAADTNLLPTANITFGGSGTNRTVTLQPATNANGVTTVTLAITDGNSIVTQPFQLTVLAVNDAPFAFNQSLTNAEDTALPVTLTGFDVEGSPLTFTVVGTPAHGALSGVAPNLSYLPATNYFGPDAFTFRVSDGSLTSTVATVSITVTPVNDAPVADAQAVSTFEDFAKAITLTGSDVEGSNLTYAIVAPPAHGSLSGTPPNVTYLPATNYFGTDSFTFKVNDGQLDSTPATVSLTINAVNDPPVAIAQSITTPEDIATNLTLTGFDVEGSNLTFAVITGPTNGTLTGVAPNLLYRPNTNFFGTDSFTFRANDGQADSAAATVSLTITPVNDAPVAFTNLVVATENQPRPITLTGADLEGSNLVFSIVSTPTNGTLSGTPPNVTYLGATNFNGQDSFTFKVNDGQLDSLPARVVVSVSHSNYPPVANAQSVTNAEDTAKAITLTGSDLEGSNLTFSVVGSPAHGSLSGSAPNLTYLPATNYFGSDSFTFKANDGQLDSAPATVSITVTPVNDAPTASLTGLTNGTPFFVPTNITLTASASDVDGTVSKVEFYAGAVKIGEKTNAPYTITWTNPASADYALTAVATDNSGALGTSAVVNVSVIWFRGINLNGTNVTVEGRSWMGYAQAQSNGLTVANSGNGSTSITPVPATDFDTRSMLQKYLYRLSPATNQGINFTQTIPNGSYKVYLWMMEDFQNNFRSMDVKLEGTPVATNIGLQSVGGWTRYGPYSTTVSDGVLNLDVLKNKNDISVSGVVIVSPNGNSGAP